MGAIADHYWGHSYSVRDYPAPIDALVTFAKHRKAGVALFFFYKEEEALVLGLPRAVASAGSGGRTNDGAIAAGVSAEA